ncbi:hypothetical protein niasHT_025079 [Heterodera trifolii]|uniref:BTB domain-containing protein n=1 Tax=Heterodera trifolii TaxID=157864 RepID=A0ABD2K0Y5_9BILA
MSEPPPKETQLNLADRMEFMFLKMRPNFADVYFVVGGQDEKKKRFEAHKAILIAASDVFMKMFSTDGTEIETEGNAPDNAIAVTDIRSDAFELMLIYMYSNDCSRLNAGNVFAVQKAADKYNVVGMMEECEQFRVSTVENPFGFLRESRLLEKKVFGGRCLAYIDRNAENLLKSDEFLAIDQQTLYDILSRDQLKVSEEKVIWQAALRWVDERCTEKGIECSGDNRRQMLGEILKAIRFPLMAQEDFVKSVVPSQVLTDKEVISVLLFHSHSVATECGAFDQFPLQFETKKRAPFDVRQGMLELVINFGAGETISSDEIYVGTKFRWQLMAMTSNTSMVFQFKFVPEDAAYEIVKCSATFRIVSQSEDAEDLTLSLSKSGPFFGQSIGDQMLYPFSPIEKPMEDLVGIGWAIGKALKIRADIRISEAYKA